MSGVGVEDGGFTVDAVVVAAAFGLNPSDVPALMRTGAMTGRTERGEGEDAGRFRLTLFHGGRALRLTVDESGAILSRSTFPAHPPTPGGV